MKRIAYCICLLIVLSSCGGDSGPSSEPNQSPAPTPTPTSTAVTGVSLNKTTLSLVEGKSETLTATVTPSSAVNKNVLWKSSDTSIASIDANGVITAQKPGTVTITVSTVDGNKTATLTLTVTIDYITRQKKVLVALYDAMNGSSWTNKDGWKKDDVELKNWYGIKMEGEHVVSINLSNNNLKGKLPASIGETLVVKQALKEADTRGENDDKATTRTEEIIFIFGNLKELDLSNNEISGSIPPEIGNLTNLTILNLSNNNISGSIPPEVGKLENLTNLDLGNNNISGNIPAEVGNLSHLTSLNLGSNDLTGSVPEELGKLKNLQNLTLSGNKLDGLVSSVLQESDMWKNLIEEPDLTQQDGHKIEKESHVESVSLNKADIELTIGNTITLIATITPPEATNKNLIWSSNNANVASVNNNGEIKAWNEGTAIISVRTEDNDKTAECVITVVRNSINYNIEGLDDENQDWSD